MPELPEVETTRRGIRAALVGARSRRSTCASRGCAGAVEPRLVDVLAGQRVLEVRDARSTC